MDDIPNKTVNRLGIVVDVNIHKKEKKIYLEIIVPVSETAISFNGVHYYRSGSTNQELRGNALNNFILNKMKSFWEDMSEENKSITDLDTNSIQKFIRKAIAAGRIPKSSQQQSVDSLFRQLNLIKSNGTLTKAAVLLFEKKGFSILSPSCFRIGRFGKTSSDLLTQDLIDVNLFEMPDKVMEILEGKYLSRPISYVGLERIEPLEYPEPALREAILNAIIHKDYSDTNIFMRIYEDRLHLWNPGKLHEELTIEKLKGDHSSKPRNRNIANIFYLAGYIESWGRGTNKIYQNIAEAGLPEPTIIEELGGISVTFHKDLYTDEYLRKLGLNERQVKAILYAKKYGQITNLEYQKINGIGKSVSATDIQALTNKKILERIGTAKNTRYILAKT